MNKTFQSFVFGCRVNEAERIKIDKELVEAGFTVDLSSPSFLIINTCAITAKAEREARQLIYQLRKTHPQAQIVVTGCSATVWQKYQTPENKLADIPIVAQFASKKQQMERTNGYTRSNYHYGGCILVPNSQKSKLVSLLLAHRSKNEGEVDPQSAKAKSPSQSPLAAASADKAQIDKFRHSNRLLVKIQDGCHRFCTYCIVPYLRGLPQSQSIKSIISYIQSFTPVPSEVILSAINTEAFGVDSKESFIDLIKQTLEKTKVPRLAFGSVHPWSLTKEFINYYRTVLSTDKQFVNFFHVPIQSGSQTMLGYMRREYNIRDIIKSLKSLQEVQKNALIATDVIVGFLGETNELFEETYELLAASPISRFHVFRFSNRPHTAAFYLKKQLSEPTSDEKKERADKLLALSRKKYSAFVETQVGRSCDALIIAKLGTGYKVLLDNHVEGRLQAKHCLPGQLRHVTILAAKDGLAICKES